MKKIDDLDLIVRMNGPLYRRIRENCCEFHGLGYGELDRHAASIVRTVAEGRAKVGNCRVVPSVDLSNSRLQERPDKSLQNGVGSRKSSSRIRGAEIHELEDCE